MLDHAFKSFREVWFHIAPSNIRSQKATAKLGAKHTGDAVFNFSGSATLWMCFCLTKQAWEQTLTDRVGYGE
jgi:RimJ/RimL family protein N-acetyltransferase